jgi:vacuolar-type H+-ATPase subunit H
MNEKLVQEVIEIEKTAQATYDAAVREADQLPAQAQQEAEGLIEKARREAQDEARKAVQAAKAEDASTRLLAEAEEEIKQARGLSKSHLDRAVNFVIDRVAGRE